MKGVFLDNATIDASIDRSRLEQCFSSLEYFAASQAHEIVSRAYSSEVIVTNKVILDKATLAQLPNLKLICVTATGTNNVDLVAAKNQGVAVTNVAGYSTYSVAQHVFAFLLNLYSRVDFYTALNRTQPWHQSEIFCQIPMPIHLLCGRTLGIVGYGNIGKTVARIGESLGMQVIVAERPGAKDIRDGRVSFESLLKTADIVSLHCPLTQQTNNLFDKKTFSLMKNGAVLVNTARGPIVDSHALSQALVSGQLSHAIIDVLETEPPEADHPLVQPDIPNLTLTHHIAWGAIQAQQQLIDSVAENIQAFTRGEQLNRIEH